MILLLRCNGPPLFFSIQPFGEKWLLLAFHRSISDSVPQGKGEGTWKQEDVEQ